MGVAEAGKPHSADYRCSTTSRRMSRPRRPASGPIRPQYPTPPPARPTEPHHERSPLGLLLLDGRLPTADSFCALRQLRARGIVPILEDFLRMGLGASQQRAAYCRRGLCRSSEVERRAWVARVATTSPTTSSATWCTPSAAGSSCHPLRVRTATTTPTMVGRRARCGAPAIPGTCNGDATTGSRSCGE